MTFAAPARIDRAGGTVIALDNQQASVDGIAEEVRALGGTIHGITAGLMDVAECD